LFHTFTTPGTYIVTMMAVNQYGSSTASMGVTVVATSDVDFTADHSGSIAPGTLVTFTDKSTPGGTAWAWNFGTGEGTSTTQNPTHTYNTPGTYTVSLTVTYPSPIGPLTETKLGYIVVPVGLCTVPKFDGVRFNDAQALFNSSPWNFTGVVIKATGAPNGNFIINAQSLNFGDKAPCNFDITVNRVTP
jgi:PKD repeat protein